MSLRGPYINGTDCTDIGIAIPSPGSRLKTGGKKGEREG